jgi:uncharacterized protein
MEALPRLRGLLREGGEAGPVRVGFEFVRTPWGAKSIRGHIDALLPMTCERCLGAMELPMRQDFELLIDAREGDDEAGLEVIHSDEGWIDLFALVEEELMLALPIIRRHEDTACNGYLRAAALEAEENGDSARDNPFAALAVLKAKL